MTLSQIYRTALIAIAGSLLTAMFHAEAVAQTNPARGIRNIVIVHGAWADGSSWSKVIPLLQARGLHVVAVQNPLTSLADDVAATKRAIALQDGPVLLVGHSYGGVVITEAGKRSQGSRFGLCGCARAVGWRVRCFGHQTVSAGSARQRSACGC